MNFNKVFLLGNLTRDPEVRQTPSGQSVATFSIATNSFFTDRSGQRQQRAEFHNVVAWGKQADVVGRFLRKGGLVFVEGRLQTRSWQDSQGQTRRVTEIICERLQLGPRGNSNDVRQEDVLRDDVDFEAKEDVIPDIDIEDEIKAEDIPF